MGNSWVYAWPGELGDRMRFIEDIVRRAAEKERGATCEFLGIVATECDRDGDARCSSFVEGLRRAIESGEHRTN